LAQGTRDTYLPRRGNKQAQRALFKLQLIKGMQQRSSLATLDRLLCPRYTRLISIRFTDKRFEFSSSDHFPKA
jgi:hypothetical protein